MKYLFLAIFGAFILSSCGGLSKKEKDEMKQTLDSASKDTTGQSKALDSAEDFLNDSNVTEAKK